jgi:hypothetical protein
MKRRLIAVLLGVALLAGVGAAAWRYTRPEPPPPVQDRTYQDVDRAEYEAWMQDLGYTE